MSQEGEASEVEKTERIKEAWRGLRIALVDDDANLESPILRIMLETTLGEGHGVIVDEYTNPKNFIGMADEYDVVILDGNFGPNIPTGPSWVESIRAASNPIIVARTGEKDLDELFEESGVDVHFPKYGKKSSYTEFFDEFLQLPIHYGEKPYKDPSKMDLEELIATQGDD